MAARARPSRPSSASHTHIPPSSLRRAKQDQDFDPFSASASNNPPSMSQGSASSGGPSRLRSSQQSSQLPTSLTRNQSSRRALAEETNSVSPRKRHGTFVKRSPSEQPDLPEDGEGESPISRRSRRDRRNGAVVSDGEGDDDAGSAQHASTSSPSKRRRIEALNGHGHANGKSRSLRIASEDEEADPEVASDTDDEEVVNDENGSAAVDVFDDARQALRSQRSEDGFLPGSIRRISLHNFLTYDSVDFRVGPYLNMVCGPNGTGKSSIACAIALGLGGSPAVLGRASKLGVFVKSGKPSGWIQIELQGFRKSPNKTIKRILHADSDKSEWYVDNRSSTKRDVLDIVASYNIDVSNLCSFLPQDKVAEFAKMTDVKRLIETQKAAGGRKLIRWHEKLIEYGQAASGYASKLKDLEDEKKHQEQRNQALQVDVQRFEERKQIEERIERLEVMIAMAEYNRAKRDVVALQQIREQKKEELRRAEARSQPIRAKRSDLEDKTVKVKLELEKLERTWNSDDAKRRKLASKVVDLGKQVDEMLSEVGMLTKRDEERRLRMQTIRQEIEDLKTKVAEAPESARRDADTSDIDDQLRAIRNEMHELVRRSGDIRQEKSDISIESQAISRAQENHRQRLAGLDDVRQQRLEMLRKADEAAYQATVWLRENQHRFRKRVYDPILLEIQLKDPRYAAAVESCIPFNVQKSFICQTRADYDLLASELLDKRKLRITIAEVEGIALESLQPPVPREEMASHGFEGYILDFVEGPSEILVYLCRRCNLEKIPVSLSNQINVERIEQSGRFRRFIIGTDNYVINVSRYGSDLNQTISRKINAPRSLVNSVNRELQEQLRQRVREASNKKIELEGRTAKLMDQEKQLKEQEKSLQGRVSELKEEKERRKGSKIALERSQAMLKVRERELRDLTNQPPHEERRGKIMIQVRKLTEKRSELMQDLKALVVAMSKVADRKHIALLTRWQWDATDAKLQNLIKDIEESETALAEACEEAINMFRQAKRAAQELQARVQQRIDRAGDLVADLDPDDDETLDLERCGAELRAEKSKLELAEGVRPEVIDQYTRRQKEIQSLTTQIQELKEMQVEFDQKISSVRGKWEPALRSVVREVSNRFSKAFDDLGLAGELRIVEDSQDYAKWKLQIMVKFRNSEDLAPLSASHQSGGEKSLSTIMYVMSLLQLSRSPFTLVDEINQGMDSRAERAAHNHIVSMTCQQDSSQYFLITPKLLPDLRCHVRQKILLVNNGEWIPEGFSFEKVISKRKQLLGLPTNVTLRTAQLAKRTLLDREP